MIKRILKISIPCNYGNLDYEQEFYLLTGLSDEEVEEKFSGKDITIEQIIIFEDVEDILGKIGLTDEIVRCEEGLKDVVEKIENLEDDLSEGRQEMLQQTNHLNELEQDLVALEKKKKELEQKLRKMR